MQKLSTTPNSPEYGNNNKVYCPLYAGPANYMRQLNHIVPKYIASESRFGWTEFPNKSENIQ